MKIKTSFYRSYCLIEQTISMDYSKLSTWTNEIFYRFQKHETS